VTNGVRSRYGPKPAQFGELYRPAQPRHDGTVVIVHGGFWRARYDLAYGRPLAADLAAHGFTAWNIEYRRVGDGGGWPATAEDVGAAVDHLATLDVDTDRVVAIGHSAGGHLAVWAAGREAPRVPLAAAVAQAGVLDLIAAHEADLGDGAVAEFLGGRPDEAADRYRAADPVAAAPLPTPVLCVHARADDIVPISQSRHYVEAAEGRGALREVAGDHFTVIDPLDGAWTAVREALPGLFSGDLPHPA
jgi:acetyl esterase/lipase